MASNLPELLRIGGLVDCQCAGVRPLVYLPYRYKPQRDMSIMARTRVSPGTLGTVFRREVQAVDGDMPIYNLRTLEERLALNYWAQQVFGVLFAIFAAIAPRSRLRLPQLVCMLLLPTR
jgi:hypothetical protein